MRFLPLLMAAVLLVQQPQFRGGVEPVNVDLRVVGQDGQPIADLRPDALVLKVDGLRRRVHSVFGDAHLVRNVRAPRFPQRTPGNSRSEDGGVRLGGVYLRKSRVRSQPPDGRPVRLRGPRLRNGSAPEEEQRRDDAIKTLEDIAGVTGGDLFRLSASADAVFDRLIRETSAYYELGFEPAESDRNGRNHAISVKVNRPKVSVRATPSFAIPKGK